MISTKFRDTAEHLRGIAAEEAAYGDLRALRLARKLTNLARILDADAIQAERLEHATLNLAARAGLSLVTDHG